MREISISFVTEVALISVSTPSLREKRARFSLSTILEPITHQPSSSTAAATPATESTTIPATALRWLVLLLLLLVYITGVFLLVTTIVCPLLMAHVPVLLTSIVPHVTVGRHLLVVSRLLLLLTVRPVLRGERS